MPEPALQVGMHHAALDRAGPDDRDLDDEIVELLRLEPRQHRHLRPALDLEHADGVGAMGHLVDARSAWSQAAAVTRSSSRMPASVRSCP